MQNKDNQSKRIYLKATRQWVDVSEEYYRDHTRYHDALRKRQQSSRIVAMSFCEPRS